MTFYNLDPDDHQSCFIELFMELQTLKEESKN